MNWHRLIRIVLWGVLGVALAVGLLAGGGWWYFHPRFEHSIRGTYGERHDRDLILDVVRPSHPNGLGIVFIVSGGWKSGTNSFRPWMAAPLLRRGYTVIPVYHVSQPDATVMEIIDDMHRAVRFIRYHARDYGINPDRLGVVGGSAGGHLSLMLATRGGPGSPEASDPVNRASSEVQAVAIFYPVTDLLNLGSSTENLGDGGPPKSFVRAFGPQSTNLAVWREIGRESSPIYFVTSNFPPTLIIHGDADTLVPLEQTLRFQTLAQELGRVVEVVIHPGGGHGWLTLPWDIRKFARWFDEHL
ncbi:MAG TPA: alpha/beta hydrolase [Verrucomicrobiota bacterium]|nr:alpha/beta hydrolase [Verrucomicrobiota bacterium]